MRAMAVLISLLAFPAVEDITGAVSEQYTLRVWLIGLVVLVSLVTCFWQPRSKWERLPWMLLVLLGMIGLILPTWIYLQVRPFASEIMGVPIGIGLGVLLNGTGHLLVAVVSFLQLKIFSRTMTKNAEAPASTFL
jgi:hypothetical protein